VLIMTSADNYNLHMNIIYHDYFQITHRRSLWKHHGYALIMDGRGEYTFKMIDQENIDEHFGS
jgi:hypothetical protein